MYTTEQGDTWDNIAYKVYGPDLYIYAVKPLMMANMRMEPTRLSRLRNVAPELSLSASSGWNATGSGSTVGIVSNVFTSTGTGATSFPYSRSVLHSLLAGNTYYIRCRVRALNSDCTQITMWHANDPTTVSNSFTVPSPAINAWNDISMLLEIAITGNYFIQIGHAYPDTSTANGAQIEVHDSVGVFNITSDFSGETAPTQLELDTITSEYYKIKTTYIGANGVVDPYGDLVSTVIFSSGISIITPEITEENTAPQPPWRDAS